VPFIGLCPGVVQIAQTLVERLCNSLATVFVDRLFNSFCGKPTTHFGVVPKLQFHGEIAEAMNRRVVPGLV
jgi:hypothetical protein